VTISSTTFSSSGGRPPTFRRRNSERNLVAQRWMVSLDAERTEIATEVGIAPSTLTHHVIVLRDAGLVRGEQTGAKKYLVRRYREVSLPLR
jgi:DNA-binding transcriptional ArsR family regulator